MEVETIRPLVGFLTSGGFSYHHGRGVGVGAVLAQVLEEIAAERGRAVRCLLGKVEEIQSLGGLCHYVWGCKRPRWGRILDISSIHRISLLVSNCFSEVFVRHARATVFEVATVARGKINCTYAIGTHTQTQTHKHKNTKKQEHKHKHTHTHIHLFIHSPIHAYIHTYTHTRTFDIYFKHNSYTQTRK